jgi:hypothetical protein
MNCRIWGVAGTPPIAVMTELQEKFGSLPADLPNHLDSIEDLSIVEGLLPQALHAGNLDFRKQIPNGAMSRVARRAQSPTADANSAIEAVHAWNDRKRKMLRPAHFRVAWERIQEADVSGRSGRSSFR